MINCSALQFLAALLCVFAIGSILYANKTHRSWDRFGLINATENPIRFKLQIIGLYGMAIITGVLAIGIL